MDRRQPVIYVAHIEDYSESDWKQVARMRDEIRNREKAGRPEFHRLERSDDSAVIYCDRDLSAGDIRFRPANRDRLFGTFVGLLGWKIRRDSYGRPVIDGNGYPMITRLDGPVVVKLSSSTGWKFSPLRIRGTGTDRRAYSDDENERPRVQMKAEEEMSTRYGRTFDLAPERGKVDPRLVPEVVQVISEITAKEREVNFG
jgi:hypothetical protein